MAREFRTPDWASYKMAFKDPHRELEPPQREVEVVGQAVEFLHQAGVLPRTDYDPARFAAHRQAVREHFEIPWTAITPRMQRLLYAVNAAHRPATMIAAGVFCGNTFISNAGAAIGPGACYEAKHLVGIEIKPQEAARAARNVARIDARGQARIVAEDAVPFVAGWKEPIDLLYLDADGTPETGKGIYLTILQAGYDRIPPGGLVVAHNSVNCAAKLQHYLAFVRDPRNFRESVNVVFDDQGLEVSVR